MSKALRNISSSISSLFGFVIALILFFISVRVTEVIAFSYDLNWSFKLFVQKSIYLDLLTGISIGFYLLPLCLFFFRKNNVILLTLFVLIAFNLVFLSAFHFSCGRLLGNDLYNYSFDELRHIISSSLTIELITYICVMVLLMISVVWGWLKSKEGIHLPHKIKMVSSIAFLVLVTLVWNNNKRHLIDYCHLRKFDSIQEFYLGNSKLPFFIQANIQRFMVSMEFAYAENISEIIKLHLSESENHNNPNFPFLVEAVKTSSLSPYFNESKTKPNIVIIIVESLSASFSGPTNYLGSYTPFIDSLRGQSLHWPNTLSNAEKSYGAVPNILGSLPYGTYDESISKVDNLYSLKHTNLFSLLPNHYYMSYSCGGSAKFDNTGSLLLLNKIDLIQDKYVISKLVGHPKDLEWGHNDYTLFNCAIDQLHKEEQPFATVLFTLGMHHPFDQKPMNKLVQEPSKTIRNENIVHSIQSADESLQLYFDRIKTKTYFDNTIFIITGDHHIDGIPYKTPIDAFHVPLLIYSPLLKEHKTFWNIVTHRDILPSLIGLLNENYDMKINNQFSSTGFQLDTHAVFNPKNENSLSFRNEDFAQYIHNEHYLIRNEVWQIEDSLLHSKRIENDSIKSMLKSKVFRRKVINDYTIRNNKLITDQL